MLVPCGDERNNNVVGIIHKCPVKDDEHVYACRTVPSIPHHSFRNVYTNIKHKGIFCMTEVHCRHNPATMIKDEGILPTIPITVLFVSDESIIP